MNRFLATLVRFKKELGIRIYFGVKKLNEEIIKVAQETKPHFILIHKPVLIEPGTVENLKKLGTKVFTYFADDIQNPLSVSRRLYKALPLYDAHFTNKSHQIEDLKKMGGRKVFFVSASPDLDFYYPEKISEEEKKKLGADLVFIGNCYEKYRAEFLERVCRYGYNIKIYGSLWDRLSSCRCLRKSGSLMLRPAEGDDYRRVMNSSKIAIALLSKMNRDQHTRRTFEIPACGTFMLHERTPEAVSFFKEGEEAEFFSSFDELIKKIDYYLKHEKERGKIAVAGLKKARSYKYSYLANAQKMLNVYKTLTK